MPFERRVYYVIGILVAAAVSYLGLTVYLEAAGPLRTVHLTQPLSNVPKTLGNWVGQDLSMENRSTYGDDHLFRRYTNPRTNQSVTLWMVYSTVGKDRGHHPEVCMMVAGKQEDTRVRQTFNVAGHDEPVQQFRFLDTHGSQWVFYWHYTLLPPENENISGIQRRYQRMHKRPSSLTIEVFAPERLQADGEGAREFVKLLDASLQDIVGGTAVRGSKRIPVWVVDQDLRQE